MIEILRQNQTSLDEYPNIELMHCHLPEPPEQTRASDVLEGD